MLNDRELMTICLLNSHPYPYPHLHPYPYPCVTLTLVLATPVGEYSSGRNSFPGLRFYVFSGSGHPLRFWFAFRFVSQSTVLFSLVLLVLYK